MNNWFLSGILVTLFAFPSASLADLTHRWSFNETAGPAAAGAVLNDEVSASPAFVRGLGATFDGSQIILPGTTTCGASDATISGYVDLPNGIISSKTDLTVEVWATPIAGRSWQHLFEFGRLNTTGDGTGAPGEWTGMAGATPNGGSQSGDTLLLTLCRGTNLNQQRQSNRHDNSVENQLDANLPTSAGQAYHYVLTFEEGAGIHGASGGQVRWYRDGVLITTADVSYHLDDLEDVNNWLGRNQWSILSTTNASYDEFRLYDHAFDAAEVIVSRDAGPDASFGPPVTQADLFTIHDGQKVNASILANDSGLFDPATVEIVQTPTAGTATPGADGRILYSHDGAGAGGDSFTYRVTGSGGISEPATVTIDIAGTMRITNQSIHVPNEPPATTVEVVEAFPGLNFTQPTDLANAPGDTQRLWVTQKNGVVRLIPDVTDPTPSSQTFFDLPALLAARGEAIGNPGNERGLLGIVFHPDYQTNGYFFLFYSVNIAGSNYSRLSRFSVSGGDPETADPTSELVLMEQLDQFGLHLGGDMHFGLDGYLYFSTGDEGGQFDGSSNGQRIDGDLFSGIMRIDVDKQPGNPEPHPHASVPTDLGVARYSIPIDNPYVTNDPTISYNGQDLPANTVRTEFWANGFRNPWRFCIDDLTGEIWCADVGQNNWEEINLVTAGGNYGWSFREGLHDGPRVGETPAGWAGVDPIYEYGHGSGEFQGNSVTGGLVYRGSEFPDLVGAYLFSDFVSGNIWALTRPGGMVEVERIAGEAGIVAFGTDPSDGEVLMVDYTNNRLVRLTVGTDLENSFPQTLSDTGLFADLTDLSPAPGLLPYEPNLRFWSDHAIKRRWFMIPDGTSEMTWSENDNWNYPDGMLWIKHFDLELERGDPATAQRIETRILVKNTAGSFGVSYRWNAEGTEATLVEDAGDTFDIEVIEDGMPRMQEYRIPSRAECTACHTPQAGHALSFNTRQLNQDHSFHGFSGNQLNLLAANGFFDNVAPAANTLPRHVRPDEVGPTLEEKVRSYLAVNCANCHMDGGTASGSWDGRPHLTLEETGIINGAATNNGGDPANLLIVPGDTGHSIVANRIAETNDFSRMPPIGSTELDQEAIDLMTAWINDLGAPAPTNLSASDGSSYSEVSLSWDSVMDATEYEVWRNTTNESTSAALIATPVTTSYSDLSATALETYFYWVKTTTSETTGEFSGSDSGFRGMPSVTGVSASNALFGTHVAVSWDSLSDAASFDVFRSTTNDFGSAALLSIVVPNAYEDTSAISGVTYFYWVLARNEHGTSGESLSGSGSEFLLTPAAVSASDDSFPDRVRVTWTAVADASDYRIFRNVEDNPVSATEVGMTNSDSFDDLTAEVDTSYFYWVRAENAHTQSEVSDSNSGSVGTPSFTARPDLMIGTKITTLRGNNIYNSSGAGQKLTVMSKGRPTRLFSRLQNDAESIDSFFLRGRSGNRKWIARHFLVTGGRANISSLVRTGSYQTGAVADGDNRLYEIFAKPRGSARKKRATVRTWLNATSLQDGSIDRVTGLVKNRP